MKTIVALIESIIFSFIIHLTLMRFYYLVKSKFYSRKVKILKYRVIVFFGIFVIVFFYNVLSFYGRRGSHDTTRIPIKYNYEVFSNDMGAQIKKNGKNLDEFKYFYIDGYGVDEKYLFGNFHSISSDSILFLINMETDSVIQFYSMNEYASYCNRNKFSIINVASLQNHYLNYYYWYLEPLGLSIIILMTTFIGLLKIKEIVVLSKE